MFTVRQVSVPVLPTGGSALRVLHVSDIHLAPWQQLKLGFLRSLASLQPDLIVNTGDNIAHPDSIELLMSALGELREVPGVFIFGSNDYEAPRFKNPLRYVIDGRSTKDANATALPTERLHEQLTGAGWHDLNNRRAELTVGGYRIGFRGTDDAHHDRDDYAAVAGPAAGVEFSVGVTHAPYRRVLDAMTADGIELIFAGHTHGGQVCVPGYGALTTNCDLPTKQAKGLSWHEHADRKVPLHVSAGVGTSPFAPVRFACRPEVTLLTLLPKPQP